MRAASLRLLRAGTAYSRLLIPGSLGTQPQGAASLCRGHPSCAQRLQAAANYSGTTAAGASGISGQAEGSLLLQCPDELGIIAGVADCLVQHGSNIRTADLHVEKGDGAPDTFVCRFSFDHAGASLEESVGDLVARFRASASLVLPSGRRVVLDGEPGAPVRRHVARASGPPRVGIFISRTEHCLLAILNQVREGDLPIDIRYVVSNHPRDAEGSHVRRALLQLGVGYYHIPHAGRPREDWEADIRSVVEAPGNETDFLVLARYMQILSGSFLSWYGREVINIHHGLLPSFKGANPYRQAHEAGVKLIGATAHYVTEDLDEGPIIEQRVARLSHKDNLHALRIRSENLEAAALQDAVRYFAENRIARVGGRTVVFA